MKAKKLLAAAVAATMVMSLAACGSSNSTSEGSTSAGAEEGKKYSIGICQLVEHPALDAATEGFQDACKEKFGEDNVTFDVQNAQGEQTTCTTINNSFVSSDVDLILANATMSLQTAAQATGDIPILGTSITDYATALGIDDWTGTTGVNVSGTSDLAPIDQQEDMLVELLPDAKKVGILYCSAESNSKYQAELFEAALKEDGIEYKEYTAADTNEIQSVTTQAVSECDAIYIPTDNTMANNTAQINDICLPARVPVIAGEEGICSGCGIATLSISYYDIGYRAGEMAYEILAEGADISTMPVETATAVTKKYNEANCTELEIQVPDGYEAITTEE
ncbi:MAG: ABC transporter substrate-binding protein [Lachnospiraceae bacterium]|nr:ABC transporter substrate-binding protein [Lachnospiraceae bacterium]